MAKYAIMDNKGIIQDSNDLYYLKTNIETIREENPDIEGDLKLIEILEVYN